MERKTELVIAVLILIAGAMVLVLGNTVGDWKEENKELCINECESIGASCAMYSWNGYACSYNIYPDIDN